jgi:hypothetical protein
MIVMRNITQDVTTRTFLPLKMVKMDVQGSVV